jgi:hypothetical protein
LAIGVAAAFWIEETVADPATPSVTNTITASLKPALFVLCACIFATMEKNA